MNKEFGYMQIARHEYENRGNGKRCFVVNINNEDIVEYKPIKNTRYENSKFAKYIDFKRAWVNRGIHLPFIGRVYKRKESIKPNQAYPDYVFILKYVDSTPREQYVIMRNLSEPDNGEWRQINALAFHGVYEIYS